MQQGYVDITEIDADILGGLIGSEEYVTRLAVRNNNLVTKLYTQFKSARDNTKSKQARRALNKLTDKFGKAIDNAKGGVLVSSIKDYEDEEKENTESADVKFAEDVISQPNDRRSQTKKSYQNTFDYWVNRIDNISDEEAVKIAETDPFVKVMDYTPEILTKYGAGNHSIIMRFDTMYLAQRKDGALFGGKENAHYHGLGREMSKLKDFLESPDVILKTNDGRLKLLHSISTSKGQALVSLDINKVKDIESNYQYYNVVVTYFDYEQRYLKNQFSKFDAEILYEKESLEQVNPQLHKWMRIINSSDSNNTISQDKVVVNSNFTQKSEKDASRAERSSDINERASKTNSRERLEDRVSGDELLDAQDLIEVVKEKGGEVDENGHITLYHRTSAENAEKIRSTGYMKSKEDGLFFSTAKEGYASGYSDTVVEFSIPAEKLILDDIFDNEAHLRFPLKQAGMKNVRAYLVDESVLDKDGKSDINTRYSFNTSKTGVANDALSTYSEELSQLILQKGDYIIDSFAKLEEIVNLAFDNTAEKATAYFGIINPQILEKIKNSIPNLPKEIEGMLFKEGREYSIATTLDAIRHIVDDKSLNREDVIDYLDRFADTILEFDSVSFDYYTDSYKNKIPGLLFKKQYPDGTLMSFNLISKKKRSVILQSLYMDKANYQKKKLAKTLLMKNNLSHTPKARVGQTSNNSIPQKSDLSTKKSDINERSSKTGRDTVEMSKGEIAKFRANYTSDKVFNKRKISEALNDISLVSKLPADVRNELVQSLWKGFNQHRAYDLYSKVMTERLYATIMQETGFELEGLDAKDEKS